jgi:hypothetical protein
MAMVALLGAFINFHPIPICKVQEEPDIERGPCRSPTPPREPTPEPTPEPTTPKQPTTEPPTDEFIITDQYEDDELQQQDEDMLSVKSDFVLSPPPKDMYRTVAPIDDDQSMTSEKTTSTSSTSASITRRLNDLTFKVPELPRPILRQPRLSVTQRKAITSQEVDLEVEKLRRELITDPTGENKNKYSTEAILQVLGQQGNKILKRAREADTVIEQFQKRKLVEPKPMGDMMEISSNEGDDERMSIDDQTEQLLQALPTPIFQTRQLKNATTDESMA